MFKRLFDIVFSLIGIIVSLPVMVLISIIIMIDSRSYPIFRQLRMGLNGRPFHICKFRTMINRHPDKQLSASNDSRITYAGKFLRMYKLDELPQLFNVLIGEMSIVGPRPEVPKYVALYNEEQRKVLSVRPGMTDYASFEYTNESDLLAAAEDPEQFYIQVLMPTKISFSLKYIQEESMGTDIIIIFRTICKLLKFRMFFIPIGIVGNWVD